MDFFTLRGVNWSLGILMLIVACAQANAQESISWQQLEIKKLKEVVDTVNQVVYDAPVFSEDVKALHAKKITITGYMSIIENPDTKSDNLYLIQRYAQFDYAAEYPLDALMEIVFKSKKKVSSNLKNGSSYRLKGKLFLNESDPVHPFYILKKAKLQ